MKFKIGQQVQIDPRVRLISPKLRACIPFHLMDGMVLLAGKTARVIDVEDESENYTHKCLNGLIPGIHNPSQYESIKKIFPESQSKKLYAIKLDNGFYWPHWLLINDLNCCSIY